MEEAGKILDVLSTEYKKTSATGTKTFLQIFLVRQNVVMELTEYATTITDVTIRTADLQKVIYKSPKYSIKDALNGIGVTGNLHDKIKSKIIDIKKGVKSKPPTE
jgi:hypothetical protein